MTYTPETIPMPNEPKVPPGNLPERDVPAHQPPEYLPEHDIQSLDLLPGASRNSSGGAGIPNPTSPFRRRAFSGRASPGIRR